MGLKLSLAQPLHRPHPINHGKGPLSSPYSTLDEHKNETSKAITSSKHQLVLQAKVFTIIKKRNEVGK